MDFNTAFEILLRFEGGISNNKADKGGLTKYGISHAAYPNLNIAELTEDMARDIYERDYWNPAGCNKLKPELQYIHFDTAVNCGVVTAIKLLQTVSGVKQDGIIGPETIQAADKISIDDYANARIGFYKSIVDKDKNQVIFLTGWINRINRILVLPME